jgi:hypothetical protein
VGPGWLAAWAVLVLLSRCGLALAFQAHWLLLTRSDLGVPRGFYACGVRDAPGVRERLCTIGADGLILHEKQLPDGSVHRTWFCEGRTECHREVMGPSGRGVD